MTRAIGERLPDLLPTPSRSRPTAPAPRRAFSASRRSSSRARIPPPTSLGAATLAYTQEGAQRGIPLTTLIRSYRLGHAAAWEGVTPLIAAHAGDPEQRAIATELCSAWLFAYVDAALCLAEDFYSAERERWVRSTAATRAETIDTILAGEPIDAALASRRLGYELDRQHTAVIAWLHAHEEGRDTHAAMEAAIAQVARSSRRHRALVHPLGILSIAAWIGTQRRGLVPPAGRPAVRHARRARGSDRDRRTRARDRRAFARATARPRRPAASPSSPADRPARSPATRASRSPRSRPPTSTRPARSCSASSAGLAADDDLTTRLTATLRTYLDEHSSRSRTAKRLGIHENTVSYRIKQAEEILGRSVDQRTLELRVALALAHLVRERGD